jgi:hypothetical protein
MKTRLSNLIALVAGLTGTLLSNGCGHSSPPPRTTRIITPAPVVVHVPAEPRTVVTTTIPAPQPAPAPQPVVRTQTPPPVQQAVVQTTASPVSPSVRGQQPIEDTLNSAAAQVLKMYESGVSEDVINSYASVSADPFNLTTDHIIYFTDIGITDAVIKNMIEHDQALGIATPDLTPNEPNYATQSNSMAPANQPNAPVYAQNPPSSQAVVTPVSTTQTVIVQERPAATTQVFYDSLSPYGTWIYLNDLGWTWQPTVATVNVNWRPYYDRGSWAYTDAGWYWNSSYSWGWAPFHYGRWSRQAGYGWVWAPGSTWAPSWVSWRYSDSYCGWAPLPPYSNYSAGIGFTYHGSRVSVGFGFGLGHSHYSFVNRRHFGRRHHSQHNDRVAGNRTEQVYNDSTVINNYIVGDNNTIINEGISRDRVNRGTESEVRRVALADVGDSGHAADSRRNGNAGEAIAVYRPKVADKEARPSERQLARQETRATRKKIEERTGRSLNQEPVRRMTAGASSGSTLAARTAATTGRIAPNRSSRSITTSGLKKQDTASTKDNGRLATLSSRGTPSSNRTRARQTPTRPAVTASSSKGSSSRTSGLAKSSVPSSNPSTAARNEINANRAIASRSRLENRASQNTTVSSRSRATQIPTRPRSTPKASTSASNLAKRSTPTTTNNRVTPTYQAPRTRTTTPAPRGRVQTTQRNTTPSNTRARTITQPTRVNPPATPNYQAQNRNEVNTRRPSPSYNSNARARMSRQNTPQRQTITPRSTPSQQTYQRRSVPAPTQRTQPRYQAPQRRTPTPAPSRQTTSPSTRRQSSPSAARAYSRPTPTYNRPAPSRSTASPSRSAPSHSSSPSASRSTPQRSRGVPNR